MLNLYLINYAYSFKNNYKHHNRTKKTLNFLLSSLSFLDYDMNNQNFNNIDFSRSCYYNLFNDTVDVDDTLLNSNKFLNSHSRFNKKIIEDLMAIHQNKEDIKLLQQQSLKINNMIKKNEKSEKSIAYIVIIIVFDCPADVIKANFKNDNLTSLMANYNYSYYEKKTYYQDDPHGKNLINNFQYTGGDRVIINENGPDSCRLFYLVGSFVTDKIKKNPSNNFRRNNNLRLINGYYS